MITGVYQSAPMLVMIVAFYIMDFMMMHRYSKEREQAKTGRAWDYTLFSLAVTLLLILQPIFLPFLGLSTSAKWGLVIQALGVILILLAFGLHLWARLHLRQFYAERVEVIPEHYVVESGPYALVRHPIICSFFTFAMGLFLINPALTTLAVLIYTFWDFGHAAIKEEELLSKEVPGYTSYMKKVPRFWPIFNRAQPPTQDGIK